MPIRAPLRFALGASLVLAFQAARANEPTPAQLRGDWVPTGADCAASPLRFRAGGTHFTLVNGKDEASFGNIAWPTSYFGPDYNGISVVAIPDGDRGTQLFSIFFNADEQQGVAKLTFEEGEERPGAAFEGYNAIFRKAKALKARFPLGGVALKHCASGK